MSHLRIATFKRVGEAHTRLGLVLSKELQGHSCKASAPKGGNSSMTSTCRILDLTVSEFRTLPDLKHCQGSMNHLIEHGGAETVQALRHLARRSSFPASALLGSNEVVLQAPLTPPRNLLCIGKNYSDHVAEIKAVDASKSPTATSSASPTPPAEKSGYPVFFTKNTLTVVGPDEHIENHAAVTSWLDYEAELAVVMGTRARDITNADALNHVFGYTIANDVTARELQRRHNQFFKGKSLDRTCPLGPWIVPVADLPQAQSTPIRLWLNGELKQDSNTKEMIYSIPELISSLSAGMTLIPGDVLLTGTPSGVGYAAKPPRTLKTGDVVTIEIGGIGTLTNPVL